MRQDVTGSVKLQIRLSNPEVQGFGGSFLGITRQRTETCIDTEDRLKRDVVSTFLQRQDFLRGQDADRLDFCGLKRDRLQHSTQENSTRVPCGVSGWSWSTEFPIIGRTCRLAGIPHGTEIRLDSLTSYHFLMLE